MVGVRQTAVCERPTDGDLPITPASGVGPQILDQQVNVAVSARNIISLPITHGYVERCTERLVQAQRIGQLSIVHN
jgi:hypothetical protein